MNIVELLKGYITKDFLTQASMKLDESPGNVSSALSIAFPSILSGIFKQTSFDTDELLESAKNQAGNGIALLRDPEKLFSDASLVGGNLMDRGKQFIYSIFGERTEEVTNEIGRASNVKPASAMSLLAMAAPMVLGFLGVRAKNDNWNSNAFITFLNGQKENVREAVPFGVSQLLNTGKPLETVDNPKEYATTALPHAKENLNKSWLKYIVYALLGLTLFFILQKSCVKQPAEKFNPPAVDTTGKAKRAPQYGMTNTPNDASKLGAFNKKEMANGINLLVPQFGVENRLVDFIEDRSKPANATTWFSLDRISFEKSSAKLSGNSKEQIKNIADIMMAYPKVTMTIGAYTNEGGSKQANEKLATDRANTIRNELVKYSIEENRMKAEGFGEQRPAKDTMTLSNPMNSAVVLNVTNK